MKKLLGAAWAFCLFLTCFGEFYDGPRPPRRILLKQDHILTIAEHADDLEIVVAPDALPITVFAAQELQQFLQKALSATIPIAERPTPEKISWIIGINQWSREAGITEKGLIPESFRILRNGKRPSRQQRFRIGRIRDRRGHQYAHISELVQLKRETYDGA